MAKIAKRQMKLRGFVSSSVKYTPQVDSTETDKETAMAHCGAQTRVARDCTVKQSKAVQHSSTRVLQTETVP